MKIRGQGEVETGDTGVNSIGISALVEMEIGFAFRFGTGFGVGPGIGPGF